MHNYRSIIHNWKLSLLVLIIPKKYQPFLDIAEYEFALQQINITCCILSTFNFALILNCCEALVAITGAFA